MYGKEKMNKPLSGTTNQILLYSKGWYGKSGNIIEDIRTLVSKYCGLEPRYVSERDIFDLLASTFSECVHNEFEITEAIMEMTGKKWLGFNLNLNRKPEEVLVGKISIVDGGFVDMSKKIEGFRITVK